MSLPWPPHREEAKYIRSVLLQAFNAGDIVKYQQALRQLQALMDACRCQCGAPCLDADHICRQPEKKRDPQQQPRRRKQKRPRWK